MTTEDHSAPNGAEQSSCKQLDKGDNLKVENPPPAVPQPVPDGMSAQRVFKKVSPNQKLTLYLASRDLVVSQNGIDKLTGVLLVDPEFVEDKKVYGQVTLTFRYGREDEEVMGLKFCNEAIMCLAQLYPPHPGCPEIITPLQEALLKRLGPNAYPFNMEITPLAPPSVQLVPAKEYNGAPIGTSYDIRAYVDRSDEKLHRRSTVRMGIRVVQRAFAPPSPHLYVPGGPGRTCRDRAKLNRKALLFGCKSAPIEIKYSTGEQAKSRSQEAVLQQEAAKPESTSEPSWSPEVKQKLARLQDLQLFHEPNALIAQGTRTPTSRGDVSPVPFGLYLTNGIEDADASEEEQSNQRVIVTEPTPDEGEEKVLGAEEDEKSKRKSSGADEGIDQYRNLCGSKRPSLAVYLAGVPAPKAFAEKFYLLSDGKVCLTASLDKAIYAHGEEVHISVQVKNNSNKTVKRLKIFVVQHVDVCMFSNGKFKNVVSMLNAKDDCPIHSGGTLDKTYTLLPVKGTTKNWIALEESYNKSGTSLASTVTSSMHNPDDRNVFAIYVSYYVKVKLVVSMMGGEVSLKLPFTLMHTCDDLEHNSETLTKVAPPQPQDSLQEAEKSTDLSSTDVRLDLKGTPVPEEVVKPEKDGT